MLQDTTYREQSNTYLAQAYEELAKEDFRQASEKGWGAASQMVKAVAEERGLRHGRHNHLLQVVHRMAEETKDHEFERLFGRARDLHANFYEGWLSNSTVQAYVQEMELFVRKAEGFLNGSRAGE